jgi:NADH-quinone oxidoreductase subunit L
LKPHDAQAFSAGDRPHHEPGESVADTGHHGSHNVAAGTHDDDEEDDHAHHHGPVEPHESPWTMTVPLVVLAALSTVGGLVGIPYALSGGAVPNFFEHTLEPVVKRVPEHHGAPATAHEATGEAAGDSHATSSARPAAEGHGGDLPQSVGEGASGGVPAAEHAHDPTEVMWERVFSGISVAIALIGIGVGWTYFRRKPLAEMPKVLENKYYVDEIYDAAVINPIKNGSREGLWKVFDIGVIDGIVNGLGRALTGLGQVARQAQPGFVRSYAAIILLGAIAVVSFFVYNYLRIT